MRRSLIVVSLFRIVPPGARQKIFQRCQSGFAVGSRKRRERQHLLNEHTTSRSASRTRKCSELPGLRIENQITTDALWLDPGLRPDDLGSGGSLPRRQVAHANRPR